MRAAAGKSSYPVQPCMGMPLTFKSPSNLTCDHHVSHDLFPDTLHERKCPTIASASLMAAAEASVPPSLSLAAATAPLHIRLSGFSRYQLTARSTLPLNMPSNSRAVGSVAPVTVTKVWTASSVTARCPPLAGLDILAAELSATVLSENKVALKVSLTFCKRRQGQARVYQDH
jgi:hypothetical protein